MKAIMKLIVDLIDEMISRYRQSKESITEEGRSALDKLRRCSDILHEQGN